MEFFLSLSLSFLRLSKLAVVNMWLRKAQLHPTIFRPTPSLRVGLLTLLPFRLAPPCSRRKITVVAVLQRQTSNVKHSIYTIPVFLKTFELHYIAH